MIECEPVTSTDKLEKPRRMQQTENIGDNTIQIVNGNNSVKSNISQSISVINTLPRAMTVSNKSFHTPHQTSSLRRNVSMTNINDSNNNRNDLQDKSQMNRSVSNLHQSASFQVTTF